jgi:hypothetical protein
MRAAQRRREAALRGAMRAEFKWEAADPELPLYLLLQAAATKTARTLSCHQDIASHGAATFMLVAEFATPVAANPAAYRHLHWEAGMLGHVVTLGPRRRLARHRHRLLRRRRRPTCWASDTRFRCCILRRGHACGRPPIDPGRLQ